MGIHARSAFVAQQIRVGTALHQKNMLQRQQQFKGRKLESYKAEVWVSKSRQVKDSQCSWGQRAVVSHNSFCRGLCAALSMESDGGRLPGLCSLLNSLDSFQLTNFFFFCLSPSFLVLEAAPVPGVPDGELI